ncbi:molybdenum ABC transporter ATP-binding protein [Desulfogranum marinum]|jgi:molybdate transport system ATP-binding protein|uniref:molybdenum ABC transporter ATP-binding protein n=1 Tax=Desulfogranum marinum TaxID=453220 RepID=UPI001964EE3E|nr:molybdenum ABC transporter ATP-binding protein [Desulfogranum marinum]MBM9513688.1 molybdenum ABC transporter ATP-binding protein [Desulfogranum marinum]
MYLEVDIEKQHGDFQCKIAFTLHSEECGVFGPSGSGKTSLMHMLAGLLTPDRGTIRLNGATLFDKDTGINLPPDKRRIGVVFQHARLFPHMSVKKNLFYGMNRVPRDQRNIDPKSLIDALQIKHLLKRNVSNLSGGERQRIALGRTILACPHLILLDEPMSGLDGTMKYQIIPHLQAVFKAFSIPILFISHSLQEMRLMTQEVLVMDDGHIQHHVPTEKLARTGVGSGGTGYVNLLHLDAPQDLGRLLRYQWGNVPLMLVKTKDQGPGQFALGSRDILLFKKHPEASSARNVLPCIVRKTYQTDWLSGVELDCNGNTLIAEIVPQSLEELDIRPGCEVIAVFKASAFERLY